MSTIAWTSAISAFARDFSRIGKRGLAGKLDRLSARDLADLNLPSEVRTRLDIQRELRRRDQIGF